MMPFFLTVQSSNLLVERARRGRCTRIREVAKVIFNFHARQPKEKSDPISRPLQSRADILF
jgi:hypothetical protein